MSLFKASPALPIQRKPVTENVTHTQAHFRALSSQNLRANSRRNSRLVWKKVSQDHKKWKYEPRHAAAMSTRFNESHAWLNVYFCLYDHFCWKKKKASSKTYNLHNYHPSIANWNLLHHGAVYVITNNMMWVLFLKIKWLCLQVDAFSSRSFSNKQYATLKRN